MKKWHKNLAEDNDVTGCHCGCGCLPWTDSLGLLAFHHLVGVFDLHHILLLGAAEDPADNVVNFDRERVRTNNRTDINLMHHWLCGHHHGSKDLRQSLTEMKKHVSIYLDIVCKM